MALAAVFAAAATAGLKWRGHRSSDQPAQPGGAYVILTNPFTTPSSGGVSEDSAQDIDMFVSSRNLLKLLLRAR